MSAPTDLRCEYETGPLGLDTPEPRFSWWLPPGRDLRQRAYHLQVASATDGFAAPVWDSGAVADAESHLVPYAGPALTAHRRYVWRVRVDTGDWSAWSEPAVFATGFLGDAAWPAEWIRHPLERMPAVPLLHRDFSLDAPPREARLHVAARGCADLLLNGEPVSDALFTPGWTDYRRRIPYRCWDVTGLVRSGDNRLAALLAPGWYAGPLSWDQKRHCYGAGPELLVALHLVADDGSERWLGSDADWRSRPSAILATSFLNGERFDATLDDPARLMPGDDDEGWQAVATRAVEPEPRLERHAGPPVRRIAEFVPIERWQPRPGAWIVDLGQNIAGFARLRVEAPAGTVLRLRFAEVLTPQRALYVDNLRTAEATDHYVCAGGGVEVWEPRFTFHGFRYVELTGLPGEPADDTVTGVAIASDCPPAGSFSCSEPMLERLAANAVWTQRANYIDVPTDCPQRDERLGWTGDAQAYVRTAACFHEIAGFFTKWLRDLDDATTADGRAPAVAPRGSLAELDADAAWGDATTICPWTIYACYRDRRLLARHYDLMRRYVGYCRRTTIPGRKVRYRGGHVVLPDGSAVRFPTVFGDWLAVDARTADELIMTAFYAHSVRLTAQAARALDRADEAAELEAEWEAIRRDFQREFVASDGRIRGYTATEETQTGYVLALHFDLVTGPQRAAALEHLVADIAARDHHLSTGFVGQAYLLPVLSSCGRTDLAYRLLLERTYPSWGYEIEHGATTIWERWNGYHHEQGPGDPNMNSYSHYAYGAVCEWLFTDLVGIDQLEPGFRRLRIRPRPGGGLTHAAGEQRTPYGPARCAWRLTGHDLEVRVTVPSNTTASIELPTTGAICQDGETVPSEPADDPGFRRLEVGSGERTFRVDWLTG